jgi:hypothetical protein
MSTCNFHTLEANGSECCSKDSQGYTPRTCYSFNYKNGTWLKPSLSSTMELRWNDKGLYLSIYLSIHWSTIYRSIYLCACILNSIYVYILSNYLNWTWTFTHSYCWWWMEVFGQEIGSVFVTYRSSRIGEGWELGLRLDQALRECCSGPALNLHCQELGNTKCPFYHLPCARFTGKALDILTNLLLVQGHLMVYQVIQDG